MFVLKIISLILKTNINTCKSIILENNSYIDNWGNWHYIKGIVREGTLYNPTPSKNLVWSTGGIHFDKFSGKSTCGTIKY